MSKQAKETEKSSLPSEPVTVEDVSDANTVEAGTRWYTCAEHGGKVAVGPNDEPFCPESKADDPHLMDRWVSPDVEEE